MQPLVSCIIPTHNRANLLIKSVESVLAQTYKELEVIIVDDHSTDNTKEVIQQLKAKDNRVNYFINPGKGANAARNYGIKMAKGEYVAFNDDDDLWLPEKLEKQTLALIKNDADICFCTYEMNGKFYPFKNCENSNEVNKLLSNFSIIGTPTLLLKKSIIVSGDKYFDEKLNALQDWDFLLNFVPDYKFHHLNEVLIVVNRTQVSITNNSQKLIESHLFILDKHRLFFKKSGTLPSRLNVIANMYYNSKDYKNSIKYYFQYIHIKPFSPRAIRALLYSIYKLIYK